MREAPAPLQRSGCVWCGRLLVVDVLNPAGRCTRGCGGRAALPPQVPAEDAHLLMALVPEIGTRWARVFDELKDRPIASQRAPLQRRLSVSWRRHWRVAPGTESLS